MIFNDMLIGAAELILGLWDAIKDFFIAIGHGLDYILQPIMSPLLTALNPVCTAIADAAYAMLSPLPVWLGLTIISVIVGVVMLVAFRHTSNQAAIGRAKDDIKANLLALKLYKDELRVVFRSQIRLLWAILRLQRYVLTPVLIMLPPMMLILAQMGIRYQWRSVQPGESVLLMATWRANSPAATSVDLDPPPEVTIEAGPVPGAGRVVWRISGSQPGRHIVRIRAADETIEKELVVGHRFERVGPLRPSRRWTDQLLHPAESPPSDASPIHSVAIDYPPRDSWFHGSNYWVVSFFVISMITALLLKPIFKVKF